MGQAMDQVQALQKLSKPELSVALASLVRDVICPDGKWTVERGRDCIEVLLIAARMAYPSQHDIENMGKDNTITETAVKIADQIDVIKEEAKQVEEQSP